MLVMELGHVQSTKFVRQTQWFRKPEAKIKPKLSSCPKPIDRLLIQCSTALDTLDRPADLPAALPVPVATAAWHAPRPPPSASGCSI